MRRLSPVRFVLVALAVVFGGLGVAGLGGCAGKPGTRMSAYNGTPLIEDPSNTRNSLVYDEEHRVFTWNATNHIQTNIIRNGEILGQNGGGAGTQNIFLPMGSDPDGRPVFGVYTGIADIAIDAIERDPRTGAVKITGLRTSVSDPQRAINEKVDAYVDAWKKASDNERAVLEKQLDTQAKMGDVAASLALQAIKSLVAPGV